MNTLYSTKSPNFVIFLYRIDYTNVYNYITLHCSTLSSVNQLQLQLQLQFIFGFLSILLLFEVSNQYFFHFMFNKDNFKQKKLTKQDILIESPTRWSDLGFGWPVWWVEISEGHIWHLYLQDNINHTHLTQV